MGIKTNQSIYKSYQRFMLHGLHNPLG